MHVSTCCCTHRSARSMPSTMPGSVEATSSHVSRLEPRLAGSQLSDSMRLAPLGLLLVTPMGEQPLVQLAPSPVQADLGRCFADSQLGRDRLVRQVVDIAQ